MARRRTEGPKKADLGFDVPPFDEGEFIRKETISFRTTLILFVYSIATALVTFFAWVSLGQSWALALLIGLGLGVALRWIYPALKVDISHFKRKEWIGTGFLYFFSWLAFFIFFVNPPIYDGVAPEVQVHITPDAQEPGGPVNVTILALDNVGVDEDSLTFEVIGPGGETVADVADTTPGAHTAAWSWRHVFTDAESGTYTVRVSVADEGRGFLQSSRHVATVEQTFQVGNVLQVFLSGAAEGDPTQGRFTTPSDGVEVRIPSDVDVYRASLRTEDGTDIFLRHESDSDTDAHTVWRANADFEGFATGNNSFRVHVQEHDSYLLEKQYGLKSPTAELISSETYTVRITNEQILGEVEASLPREIDPSPVQTPGAGFALTLVGIIGAVALVARRRAA